MKTPIIYIALTLAAMSNSNAFAQKRTDKIKVSGNCEMCARNIEKAAKTAGASKAAWNTDSHILTVTYKTSVTTTDSIEKQIAKVGYDTERYSGSMDAYNNLHECCKYENKRK
jgi:copper chaperone CopZ